jgi:hypothetical protein
MAGSKVCSCTKSVLPNKNRKAPVVGFQLQRLHTVRQRVETPHRSLLANSEKRMELNIAVAIQKANYHIMC